LLLKLGVDLNQGLVFSLVVMTNTTTTEAPKVTQIFTQIIENYGAHDWDGEGECPQYWKKKGGNTYLLTEEIDPIAFAKAITRKDEYFSEFVIGTEEVKDCFDGIDPTLDNWIIVSKPKPSNRFTFVDRYPGDFRLQTAVSHEFGAFHPSIKTRYTETIIDASGNQLKSIVRYENHKGQTFAAKDWKKFV
jgi:hypothetical protein